MVIKMKLKNICSCYMKMQNITRLLIKAGIGIFLFICSLALLTYTFGELMFADFNTAVCNSFELLICARECLFVVVVPALLYEIYVHVKK